MKTLAAAIATQRHILQPGNRSWTRARQARDDSLRDRSGLERVHIVPM